MTVSGWSIREQNKEEILYKGYLQAEFETPHKYLAMKARRHWVNSMCDLDRAYRRLILSIQEKRARSTRLKNWSRFIRLRDGNRCVACHDYSKVAAHHIIRKTLLPHAQFLPGNGISLCYDCHSYVHRGFNGKPDLRLPMDTQGGEKIETMTSLFRLLSESSREKEPQYYELSSEILAKFKSFQGYDTATQFEGNDVEQAYDIWRCCPRQMRDAILSANGFSSHNLGPFGKGVTILFDHNEI